MGEYMRTILNGLKVWVGGEISKLRAKIEAVATAASKTASLAAKNKKDIAALGNNLDSVQNLAATADTAANVAKSTANAAKTAADDAKTAADNAKTAADNAVRPSSSNDRTSYTIYADDKAKACKVYIGHSGGSCLGIQLGPAATPSVKFTPPVYMSKTCDFEFSRASSGYPHPAITGIAGIVMYSNTAGSTKKFKITVNDTGTLSATEVTS